MNRSKGAKGRRQGLAATVGQAALLGGLAAMMGGGAWALPVGQNPIASGALPTFVTDPSSGGVTTVNLASPRTIIDWTAFTINPGETVTYNAQARSDIVLNRLGQGAVQINGTLQSFVGGRTGGNVWFSAPAGVFFGGTAVVNVGGLMATTATLLDQTAFLDPNNRTFPFEYEGGFLDPAGTDPSEPYAGGVVVNSGARISTAGGLLALVAPFVVVQSGATVGDAATGDVLIGAANGYTITLGQETAGDLDLLEFQFQTGFNPCGLGGVDPTPVGRTGPDTAITVAGAVTGRNVYVTALTSRGLANAIVTDNGSITATGAVQQGDGVVILTADTIDLVPASFPNGSNYDPSGGLFPGGANLFQPNYATPLSFGNITAPQTYIHTGGFVTEAGPATVTGGNLAVTGGDISIGNVNITGSFQATAEPLPVGEYLFVSTTPGGAVFANDNAIPGDISARDINVLAASTIGLNNLTATGGDITLSGSAVVTRGMNAAGAITTTAATSYTEVGNVSAGGAVSMTGPSDPQDFNGWVIAGNVSGRSVAISTNQYISVDNVTATGGPVTFTAPEGVYATSVNAAGAVTLTATDAQVLVGTNVYQGESYLRFDPGAVTGQSVNASGADGVSVGVVTATGGPITLSSTAGGVAASSLQATGAVLTTPPVGTLSIGTNTYASDGTTITSFTPGAVSGQSVTLSSPYGLNLGDVTATGGAVNLSSPTGLITTGTVTATGDVDLAGVYIDADAVNAGGAASLIATPSSQSAAGTASVKVGSLSAAQAFVQANDGLVAITSANVGAGGLEVHALGPSGDIYLGYALVTGGGPPSVPSNPPPQAFVDAAGVATGGGTGTLTGSASLYADDNINVDVASSANLAVVKAAGLAGLTAETGDLTLGTVTVGGILTAAAPQGSVSIAALDQAATATLSAGVDVTVTVEPTTLAGSAQAGRDLTVAGAGDLDLTGGFGLSAGRDVTLSSPGQLTVAGASAVRDLTLTGASIVTGSNTQAGSALSAGRNATLTAQGLATIGGLTAGTSAQITAADLNLQGALTAPTVTIASLSGPLILGGGGGQAAGLMLDSGEFGRISASSALNLYAGAPSGTARGDLVVQDLAIDPAKVPNLNLYASAGHTVSINGLVAPTTSGGAITIGGVTGWTPTTILVTGGLGAATRVSDIQFSGVRAFNQVSLNALGDILLGSQRFIGVIQATPPDQINLGLNLPAGAQPQGSEIGRVYLTSGRLNIAAGGKVVGQNTSGGLGGYSGVYLTNNPRAPGVVLTLDPPSVVDLFGSYQNIAGGTSSGPTAAVGRELAVLAGNALNYRFNGCTIGVGCGGAIPGPSQSVQFLNDQQASFLAEASTAPGALVPAPTFGIIPSAAEDAQADPVVTGTGNEEIWRRRGGSSQ